MPVSVRPVLEGLSRAPRDRPRQRAFFPIVHKRRNLTDSDVSCTIRTGGALVACAALPSVLAAAVPVQSHAYIYMSMTEGAKTFNLWPF